MTRLPKTCALLRGPTDRVTNHGSASVESGFTVTVHYTAWPLTPSWDCVVIDPNPNAVDEEYSECTSTAPLAPGETTDLHVYFLFGYGSAEVDALSGETNLLNNFINCSDGICTYINP